MDVPLGAQPWSGLALWRIVGRSGAGSRPALREVSLAECLEAVRLAPRLLFNRLRYGRFLDILLTHAPPRGIHDGQDRCHWGFRSFLWFMRVFRPRYLVHGHTHLYSPDAVRATRYAETTVLNAYDHVVLDVEAGE